MLHLRIVSPRGRTGEVLRRLRADAAVVTVSVVPRAAVSPAGDLILCDVVREGANDVIAALSDLDLHHEGAISAEHVELSFSDLAAAAERRVPGHGRDAAVWEEVEAQVREASELTAGYLVFFVVAALISAIGLFQDAPILIVGAVVVGPEFGPLAGLSVGLVKRRPPRIRAALVTLATGFAAGGAAAYVATALADAVDLVPAGFVPHDQPLTGFIVDPSLLSFAVAFLAGIVGILSLTQANESALIGVLISVTTIPAIAAASVSGALGHWHDAWGAVQQLAINLVTLVTAGVATLWAQREAWKALAPPARPGRAGRAGRDRDGQAPVNS